LRRSTNAGSFFQNRKGKRMDKNYLNRLFDLEGKTVLVTGAEGQLGKEICAAYVSAGSRVVGADKISSKVKNSSEDNIDHVILDITDKRSVAETLEKIYAKYGSLNILVNNAGISVFEPYEDRDEESFDSVMDVNLKGVFFCIQAYAKKLKEKRQKGNIVNIASIYGAVSPDPRIYTDCPRKSPEVYGATKAGVIQMTRYFATHLAGHDIRVNCVSPGGIFNPDSPQGEDFIKNYSHRCPMARMANTEEIVGGVLYLSSGASTYTTGQNLIIDGGMSSW